MRDGRCLGLAGAALALGLAAAQAGAAIEGGGERYRFEPGDEVIYESDLPRCPVGEFLPELRIARGAYECARLADRIWIRPLEHGTTLYLALPGPLPEAFSLEFTVRSFTPGRPLLRFALHPAEVLARLQEGQAHAADDAQLVAGVIRVGEASLFGAKDAPRGNLDGRWDFRRAIEPGRDHRIAVQVRRGQIRFFVDGARVGHKPFAPAAPPQVLTLFFRRLVDAPQPFAEAPVLVRDIRIAGYRTREAAPEAERDLIRDLGAEETPEGLKVTLSEAILFDFGRWALRPEARPVLDKLARLAALRKGTVRVEGHTDDVGPEQFNRVLSELRAHVVALALARRGVEPGRLVARGFGETRPAVPNDSDAHRARNRRVEVILERPGAASR
ncbi:OmpA family protein [Inmirania thermothiophila]|uniref:Outer membrane protein OmpA-like peptidoglycan-associated protein n=1 Tax=Inmirania thermothiophila TaxID=1750597 RepID=A0A3N1Y6N1_9GAMM|nr:OmpA family protein [Inmirania thermothiophila]ROR34435.1 outer membrane protein OmpA-like peptidoglycan-associated protein [Inmirania thermothiophila]